MSFPTQYFDDAEDASDKVADAAVVVAVGRTFAATSVSASALRPCWEAVAGRRAMPGELGCCQPGY